MDQSRLSFLFHHYVNNSCTEPERKELLQLILKSDNDPQVKVLMDQLWASLETEQSPLSITTTPSPASMQIGSNAPNTRYKHFSSKPIAAVVALVLIVLFSLPAVLDFQKEVVPQPKTSKISNQDHTFHKLPDGSTVVLNSGSTLHYPLSFDGKDFREVILSGEGFFDIAHDPLKPFVVRTENLTTTVLGTAFNVKAFPRDEDITITVARGKVKVSDAQQTLGVLLPDQQIVFHKPSTRSAILTINNSEALSWVNKDIFFDNITFEDAVSELEKRFAVTIDFESERLRNCIFTATFLRGEDLDQILQVICEFNNAEFFYTASEKIVVKGSGCDRY